jgi:hypothetical protein
MNGHHFEEATPMSRPTSTTPSAPRAAEPAVRRGSRRRRLGVTIAAAAVVIALGLSFGLPGLSGSASGLPPVGTDPLPTSPVLPICPNPPCGTTPTTDTPPPPTWDVQSMILNEDTGTVGAPTADRFFTPTPIFQQAASVERAKTASASAIVIPPGPWDPVPAGSSGLIGPQLGGRFSFPVQALPSGSTMSIKVREAGVPGLLCRTREVSPLPTSGTPLRILVAPAIVESPAALQAMVANFKGAVPTPAGTSAGILAASLTPQSNGLSLSLLGVLKVGTYNFIFAYKVLLTLTPVTSGNLGAYLTVQTPSPGTLTLAWFGPAPAGGDFIKALVAAAAEPQLRAAVPPQATPIVNNAVNAMHDVKWWTEQGFSLSVRKVAYSTTGLSVSAAVCRLG